MTYVKPELFGHSAVVAIQDDGSSAKSTTDAEINSLPSDPAYQADE